VSRQRVALVTGGTGAIGTEICRQLAAAGHKVAALGHPSESARIADWLAGVRAGGAPVEVHLCDLSNFSAAHDAVQKLEGLIGPADILVNAAGITRDARLAKMTPAQWREVMATNLDSVFNVTQPVFTGMCERGYGRIVNISSVNGQKGQFGQANYSAAKAGMHGFTMAVAQEGAAKGVTVNAIAPGYIDTDMVAAVPPNVLEKIVARIPVGRLGKADEIARGVLFLVADEGGFITGSTLSINGGQHMY